MAFVSAIVHDIAVRGKAPAWFLGRNSNSDQPHYAIAITAATKVHQLFRRPFAVLAALNRP